MELFDKALLGFCILLITIMVAGVGYLIYDELVSDKFYLRKDQFYCTASHVETNIIYTKVGDVSVPQTVEETICDQWTRR